MWAISLHGHPTWELLHVALCSFMLLLKEGQTGLGERCGWPTPTWGPLFPYVPSERQTGLGERERLGVVGQQVVFPPFCVPSTRKADMYKIERCGHFLYVALYPILSLLREICACLETEQRKDGTITIHRWVVRQEGRLAQLVRRRRTLTKPNISPFCSS